MLDDAIEWFPAAVMRPAAGRPLELLLRGDATPHRGSYRLDRYILEAAQSHAPECEVLSWRYAEPAREGR